MRAYVITTGLLFACLTLIHVWRLFEEPHLAADPWFMGFTVVAAVLGVWAWRVLRLWPLRRTA